MRQATIAAFADVVWQQDYQPLLHFEHMLPVPVFGIDGFQIAQHARQNFTRMCGAQIGRQRQLVAMVAAFQIRFQTFFKFFSGQT